VYPNSGFVVIKYISDSICELHYKMSQYFIILKQKYWKEKETHILLFMPPLW
jgi:hypothetical protein